MGSRKRLSHGLFVVLPALRDHCLAVFSTRISRVKLVGFDIWVTERVDSLCTPYVGGGSDQLLADARRPNHCV